MADRATSSKLAALVPDQPVQLRSIAANSSTLAEVKQKTLGLFEEVFTKIEEAQALLTMENQAWSILYFAKMHPGLVIGFFSLSLFGARMLFSNQGPSFSFFRPRATTNVDANVSHLNVSPDVQVGIADLRRGLSLLDAKVTGVNLRLTKVAREVVRIVEDENTILQILMQLRSVLPVRNVFVPLITLVKSLGGAIPHSEMLTSRSEGYFGLRTDGRTLGGRSFPLLQSPNGFKHPNIAKLEGVVTGGNE